MKINKLNTESSGSWKRDCELTDIQIKPSTFLIFNRESDFTSWKIMFQDFIALKITSEEFTADKCLRSLPVDAAFFEIDDSPWINELMYTKKDILKKCKHFVFCFYDETIEIIAKEFTQQKIT